MSTEHQLPLEREKDSPNGAGATKQMTQEEENVARAAARFGYGPLAQVNTAEDHLPPFGGEAQPGLYRPVKERKLANPAPMGLSAFAFTTFVMSLINVGTRGIAAPNIVVGAAYAYGGLVQFIAGMWEMAVGNTFGATAFASFGGFWISVGIILTPGGFQIMSTLEEGGDITQFNNSFGLFFMGWFIFCFILLLCTVKSTLAFFSLFLTLDMTFLLLGIAYLTGDAAGAPNTPILKAGGVFGLLAAFIAWYNAFAGIADTSNSFFLIPVIHFPWSPTGRARHAESEKKHEVV